MESTTEQYVLEEATKHGLMEQYEDPTLFADDSCSRCGLIVALGDGQHEKHLAWHRETTAQIRLAMFLAMASAEKVRELAIGDDEAHVCEDCGDTWSPDDHSCPNEDCSSHAAEGEK